MELLTILIVGLLVTNIILVVLYVMERKTATYTVYDTKAKNALKKRVARLKKELKLELAEFDMEEWEKALDEPLEEGIRKL
ncbi:hypothetical protein NF865_09605 [Thermococcus aggregans]|uniref:Uncharacterized protein n=1 Tax=Thermococcus aggregans TaxID=110163 RepID=A0A9E7MXB9_THEAG|nr:hypothetical protein [Thermococcus aggregans]USS40537.1 hypothetical protein NF865_09605 [Thermococcus aggregans]